MTSFVPLIYIAGPYSSHPVANTRRAISAGMALWNSGSVAVYIPHLSLLADLVAPMPVDQWYEFDLHILKRCDALYRLDGPSTGADAEVAAAERLRLPVFTEPEDLLIWADERQTT